MANWKEWAGRFGLVVIPPLLLLIALEAACRGFGWGYPTSFFVPDQIGGKDVWRTNEFYGYRFFQPLMARSPAPVMIDRAKAPGVKRVAVLGESAAMGDPLIEFSLARTLDKILNKPGEPRRYEVVNAAMTAISSPVIVDIASELARKDFDVFVVYMGNNEVVGPYGPEQQGPLNLDVFPARRAERKSVSGRDLFGELFAPLHVWWTRTRFASAVNAWQSSASPGRPWDGMTMFSENRITADDKRMENVYEQYNKNLERIATIASQKGIEAIFCTMAVNLRNCPPFGSAHGRVLGEAEAATWQAFMEKGTTALDAGQATAAEGAFVEALKIDPDHAQLNYLAASAAAKLGKNRESFDLYSRARDLDTLRVRTDSRMNDIIRDVARRNGVNLLESATIFGAAPGAESFVDHVHFTLEGVALLANAVADEIDLGRERVDAETLSQRLDYNDWSRTKLASIMLQRLENPPFTEQPGNRARLEEWRSQRGHLGVSAGGADAAQISADLTRRESEYPWDREYALQSLHRLAGIGAWPQAAILADRIRPEMRGASAANGLLAFVYAQAGRPDDAADVLLSAGPPYGYFLVDATFQLLGALDELEKKDTACTVVKRILQNGGEFPGRIALVRWGEENGI